MTFYSFDTSSLLNGRRDLFPPDTFPGIWESFEEIIGTQVISVDEVREELIRKDDDVSGWARSQTGMFVPLENDIQAAVKSVLTACPKLVAVGGKRDGADPWVIALALARGGVVVSEENPGSAAKPRIPDACDVLGVRCIRLIAFIQEQGWVLRR
jgi:hypothetical protein